MGKRADDDRVACDECDGAGELRGVGCDRRGPARIVVFPCPACGGTGKLSVVQVALTARGHALRDARVARDESVPEAARRLGIPVRELAEVEHGLAPAMLVARVEQLWHAGEQPRGA